MTDFGVVPEGFKLKVLRDIVGEIEDDQHGEISPNLDTSSVSPDGQRNGISGRQIAAGWEVLGMAYDALDPDKAEDTQLVNVCKLTGTVPQGATATEVACDCVLDAGQTLTPAVQYAAVLGRPDVLFTPIALFTAPSTGTFSVKFQAATTGPILVNAGTLTVITTPVGGWHSVNNPLDGKTGLTADDNDRLRARREAELAAAGSGTVNGIRSDVLHMTDDDGNEPIQSCSVFENEGDAIDSNGLLPHSVEVVLTDSPTTSNDLIAQAIFETASLRARNGNTSGTASDEQGNTYTIRFSRPVDKPVWIIFALETNAQYGGDAAFAITVADALRNAHASGDDVFRWTCERLAALPGVVNVVSVLLGLAPSPIFSLDIPIGVRERATFDSTHITRV